MIVGFGFGPPLVSIAMLLVTLGLSYGLYRFSRRRQERGHQAQGRRERKHVSNRKMGTEHRNRRERLRTYYYRQRERSRQMTREFDLTDEEIEQRINEELGTSDDD